MPLNSKAANDLFHPQFAEFKLNHDCINEHANKNKSDFENIFPRELRLFRVRLRLAVGLKISFDKNFAMVKNEPTEKAYIEIMKCNEAWFSYEAMNKLCHKWNLKKAPPITSIADIFDAPTLNLFNIKNEIDNFNNEVKTVICSNPNIASDIAKYLTFLEGAVEKDALKNLIRPTINKITTKQDWESKEIFGVLYATRNIFVHQGETAKSGVKFYKNKILFLKILYDYAILFQIKVVNFAFEKQISQYGLTK
jgi:hypothetical protein